MWKDQKKPNAYNQRQKPNIKEGAETREGYIIKEVANTKGMGIIEETREIID